MFDEQQQQIQQPQIQQQQDAQYLDDYFDEDINNAEMEVDNTFEEPHGVGVVNDDETDVDLEEPYTPPKFTLQILNGNDQSHLVAVKDQCVAKRPRMF